MSFDYLPPWQQIPYFGTPVATALSPPAGVATLIAPADPMRVLLVIAVTGGQAVISTLQNHAQGSLGITRSSTQEPLIIHHSYWGPLTNVEWYCNANGSLYVWQLSLVKWPRPETAPAPPPQAPWYQRAMRALKGEM